MKNYFIIIPLYLLVACSQKEHIASDQSGAKIIKGLYSNAAGTLEDGVEKEFIYFDGKGLVYYMMDTAHSVDIQTQRVLNYATKSTVSLIKDSMVFELDSFYIGKGTFSAIVFNNKTINGEDKIYYHKLMQKYSGTYRNDTLHLSILSVSMQKDTVRSSATYAKYLTK